VTKNRGSILILVLFVLVVLSLTAVSFAYRAGVEQRLVKSQVARIQLKNQVESAVAIAMAVLAQNDNDFDHPAEPWHQPPLDDVLVMAGYVGDGLPSPEIDLHVTDEEGKLHVLLASSEDLEHLGLNPVQIDSLFDWMDADDEPLHEGAEVGAYIASGAGVPYRPRNAPVQLLEELLAIRGFRAADLVGEDANHNGELDPAEDDGTLTEPSDDADGVLDLSCFDVLTTFGEGRINPNTVPLAVLETLPLSDGAADQIVAFRAFDADSRGELGDHVFRSETDIQQLQGLTDADRDLLASIAVFRSTHFRILARAIHPQTGVTYALNVVVRQTDQGIEVLQWQAW